MTTNFPTGFDSFTNPNGSDTLDSPDHAAQHSDVNDAVEAIQTKVGVDGSAVTTSLDWLVRQASPVGSVQMFAGSSAPDSWLLCGGQAVSRSTYATLFSLVGTTYGSGDGSTTFNVPNLSGRVPVGLDSGDASFDALGETGGAKTHTLDASEIPSHTHTVNDHTHSINHNHGAVTSSASGINHSHTMNHDHGSFTSGSSTAAHSHPEYGTAEGQYNDRYTKRLGAGSNWDVTAAGSAQWQASINPPARSANATHSHTVDPPSYSGSTGDANPSHTHSVDLPDFSGTSGATGLTTNATGSGAEHNNVQPYTVLNYIIKAA